MPDACGGGSTGLLPGPGPDLLQPACRTKNPNKTAMILLFKLNFTLQFYFTCQSYHS